MRQQLEHKSQKALPENTFDIRNCVLKRECDIIYYLSLPTFSEILFSINLST